MSALYPEVRPDRAVNHDARRRRTNVWHRMQSLNVAIYGMAAVVALAWLLAVMGLSIAALLTVVLIPVAFPVAAMRLYGIAAVKWNRSRFGRTVPFSGVLTVLSVALLTLTFTAGPADVAQAQFFTGAETYITTKLAGGAAGAAKAVEIIFAVLRGLFLIYLGIAIVKIVQASRNDQDWQDLARTPLIILIAVVLGDVLTAFIIGGAA
jgi:hypothetical protein